MAEEILETVVRLRREGKPCALATVVEAEGSTSAKIGAKALIDQEGRVLAGWVGGGCAESTTCETALRCLRQGHGEVIDIDLNDEVLGAGMPCGGSMRVYVEPMLPRPCLWIMGHGRIAQVLCQLADLCDLEVAVNDPMVTREHYPAASRLITDDVAYRELQPAADDYVVIATQHKGDHRSIQQALESDAGYIALIASRKRAGLVLDYLRENEVPEEQIRRVRSPCGLDLGARTPEEIALSLMSEIVMIRRGGQGGLMADKARRAPKKASA
ncbi:MAG TPA: XdhC family protein [Gammaproteobacteria bacterium]|nr:XdhC family protein [Gammaproteobacteria bacterium]